MNAPSIPSEDNGYLSQHVALLRTSFRHWLGRELLPDRMTDFEAARYLFHAPWAVVSHNADKDSLFDYANQTALGLFGMTWEEITAFPSRLSTERNEREDGVQLLGEDSGYGYIEGYRGIRIGRHGRRFEIEGAVIWNLRNALGKHYGQATCFKHWKWV